MDTQTINVNLKQCVCAGIGLDHTNTCPGTPVLIPCPIPPTFEAVVRLGECLGFRAAGGGCSGEWTSPSPSGPIHHEHAPHCPARPIGVTCTIGGDGTWAGSEVTETTSDATQWQPPWSPANEALLSACRERWALVKALVLGRFAHRDVGDAGPGTPEALFKQRDSVFAAIANMAMAESAIIQAAASLDKAYPRALYVRATPRYRGPPQSQGELKIWVAHLIEQVGNL